MCAGTRSAACRRTLRRGLPHVADAAHLKVAAREVVGDEADGELHGRSILAPFEVEVRLFLALRRGLLGVQQAHPLLHGEERVLHQRRELLRGHVDLAHPAVHVAVDIVEARLAEALLDGIGHCEPELRLRKDVGRVAHDLDAAAVPVAHEALRAAADGLGQANDRHGQHRLRALLVVPALRRGKGA